MTLTSRQAATGSDFSSWTNATITGYYYEDLDADAQIPDPGLADPPLAGRAVYIDANGNDSLDGGEPQTTTDASGFYSFANLAPGTYSVRVGAQPAGWTCNYPAPASRRSWSKRARPRSRTTSPRTRPDESQGRSSRTPTPTASRIAGDVAISGQVVYIDSNDDGDHDAGEPSATTDASGGYTLTVTPGAYTVRSVDPAGWTCTAPSPCAHGVAVTSSGDHANHDFGLERPSEIEVTADDKSIALWRFRPGADMVDHEWLARAGRQPDRSDVQHQPAHTWTSGSYAVSCSGNTNATYDVTYKPGTLTVAPRPITVTADDKSKTYGASDPALTYAITAGSLVDGDSLSGSLTRASGEGVGTYAITRGTLDSRQQLRPDLRPRRARDHQAPDHRHRRRQVEDLRRRTIPP